MLEVTKRIRNRFKSALDRRYATNSSVSVYDQRFREFADRQQDLMTEVAQLSHSVDTLRSLADSADANMSQLSGVRERLSEVERLGQESALAIDHALQAELVTRRDIDALAGQVQELEN